MRKLARSVVVGMVISGSVAFAQNEKTAMAGKSVLIAAEQSEYKKALLDKMTEALEKQGCAVSVIEMASLTKEKVLQHDATVVVTSVPAWRKKGALKTLMASADTALKQRLVAVTTANRAGWELKDKEVHAITAASKIDNLDGTLDRIEKGLASVLAEGK